MPKYCAEDDVRMEELAESVANAYVVCPSFRGRLHTQNVAGPVALHNVRHGTLDNADVLLAHGGLAKALDETAVVKRAAFGSVLAIV